MELCKPLQAGIPTQNLSLRFSSQARPMYERRFSISAISCGDLLYEYCTSTSTRTLLLYSQVSTLCILLVL